MGIETLKSSKRLRISNANSTWDAYDPDEGDPTGQLLSDMGKAIIFVLSGVASNGVQDTVVRCPFKGHIKYVYAVLSKPLSSNLVISVEKAAQTSTGTMVWSSILADNAIIPKGSCNVTSSDLIPVSKVVHANDHFRINLPTVLDTITSLTVEIGVEVI